MTLPVSERFLIGVDDTDRPGAGSTEDLACALAAQFAADGFGEAWGVTRHDLLRHDRLRITDRNAAYAIALDSSRSLNDVEDYAVRYVRQHAERGADPGIAVFSRHADLPHVLAFGRRSQQELMRLEDASTFAVESNVRLRSTGDRRLGTIGALAAVGLHAGGGDGCFVALRGIRELEGRITAGALLARTAIATVFDETGGEPLDEDDVVETLGWVRPRLVEGRPVLPVRRSFEERTVWLPVDRQPRPAAPGA